MSSHRRRAIVHVEESAQLLRRVFYYGRRPSPSVPFVALPHFRAGLGRAMRARRQHSVSVWARVACVAVPLANRSARGIGAALVDFADTMVRLNRRSAQGGEVVR